MKHENDEKVTITFGVKDIAKQVLSEIQDQGAYTKTAADDLVPDKYARRILGVTRTTLFRWEKSGYLVPVRIGSKRMYKISDLEAILKGEKINPKKPQK